jgi:hypothetical protein
MTKLEFINENNERFAMKKHRNDWSTACHEAAHAVISLHLRFKFTTVTIVPGSDYWGAVKGPFGMQARRLEYSTPAPVTLAKWHNKVVIYLAGSQAQRLFAPRSVRKWHWAGDQKVIAEMLWRLHPDDDERIAAGEYLRIRARILVRRYRGQIEDVAKELVARRTLSSEEVKQVFRDSRQREYEAWVKSTEAKPPGLQQ